ncbi:hypothetical protein GWI33_014048 [Rhynchophorus ferrugineus]|uniref:Uncharacterized protein n=1 Tax=Rhynchophorus ferrugineus TaxID=354439 RepID=A0A834I3F7_RHYFE|nr:hypothetical protein GWI33_014048 [Rhynchophorus ferrugineus]
MSCTLYKLFHMLLIYGERGNVSPDRDARDSSTACHVTLRLLFSGGVLAALNLRAHRVPLVSTYVIALQDTEIVPSFSFAQVSVRIGLPVCSTVG